MKPTAEQRNAASPTQQHARKMAEQRAELQRRQIAELATLACFQGVPTAVLQGLAPHCTLRILTPGGPTLEQGRQPSLYIVLQGQADLALIDQHHRTVEIGSYSRGACFGEGPLFGAIFRGVYAESSELCSLLQISLEAVRTAMAASSALAANLREVYRHHLAAHALSRTQLFQSLAPAERDQIAQMLTPHTYEHGQQIIALGEPGSALYLIESGQCVISRDGALIAQLEDGAFFGEISLLTGSRHTADVHAITPTTVLELPRSTFLDLIERHAELSQQLHRLVEQRLQAQSAQSHDSHLALVGSAIPHGLLRGSHLLVRDTTRCPNGCSLCTQACAERHGQPRLKPNGVAHKHLDLMDACRQCSSQPECVAACPQDAIQRDPNGALVITGSCDGCGKCAPACPYDAITMIEHPFTPQPQLQKIWQRLIRRNGEIALDPMRPAQSPDKCDLCHGHSDLACVEGCPTGALRLIPVDEIFPF